MTEILDGLGGETGIRVGRRAGRRVNRIVAARDTVVYQNTALYRSSLGFYRAQNVFDLLIFNWSIGKADTPSNNIDAASHIPTQFVEISLRLQPP